jgi:predicted oxidoreductase
MPPRSLGNAALGISPLAWGMWRFRGTDVAQAARLVHAALDAGITLFDTADIYGPDNGEAFGAAEALLGAVLEREPGLRHRMVLATKGGIAMGVPYDSRASYLTGACEASLRRLRTDRVELYQIHRPDSLTHPAGLADTLDRLRRAGKIAEAGVSNYSAAQTRALVAHLPFRLAAIQPQFSPLVIDALADGTLDLAMELDLLVLAWSPFAGGRLSGAGDGTRGRAVVAVLDRIAGDRGVARSAVAYAWIMAHPARPIPIIGSQQAARIAEARAACDVTLSRTEWYEILTAARGEPLP